MFKYFIRIFILCSLFLPSISFSDEMYTWTDENGVMHFSNTPSQLNGEFDVEDIPDNENTDIASTDKKLDPGLKFDLILAKYNITAEYYDKQLLRKGKWVRLEDYIEIGRKGFIFQSQLAKSKEKKHLEKLKSLEIKLKEAELEYEKELLIPLPKIDPKGYITTNKKLRQAREKRASKAKSISDTKYHAYPDVAHNYFFW